MVHLHRSGTFSRTEPEPQALREAPATPQPRSSEPGLNSQLTSSSWFFWSGTFSRTEPEPQALREAPATPQPRSSEPGLNSQLTSSSWFFWLETKPPKH
ncbi:Hypothetical protein SMAX5B_011586 [Scophthalmus maximus]|uniref:Uncharacterized protein n=1 Tax=Scophthalmus maximus TaxID=52904 RepID=A0A2U9BN75_SCOMX|nr:Hypothetical protein SMAX5B_011586 [Scophthalmus maximus]